MRCYPITNCLGTNSNIPLVCYQAGLDGARNAMKCRYVACIWSGTPPFHRFTATAPLEHPPTLYTGGIKPIAMLCGHAAPIADLAICCPIVVSGEKNTVNSSNVALNSCFDHGGAFLSACTDSCCFIEAARLSDHHLMECAEGGEISMDKESQSRKPPKCTVAIFDTYTHTIVQTVFHGNLSNGPLKFMDNVSSVDDGENHFSLMADSFGKLQLVPLPKDFHQDSGEGEIRLQRSSKQEIMTLEDGFVEAGQVVSIATCRTIVATVIKDRSILRLLGSGIIIGLILFMNNVLCIEDKHGQAHVIGAMFLKNLDSGNLITVMHQHVGPVRQIILPPARTERPWSDCFLSIGEDSCVTLSSLETLRVERMFPRHPDYPAKVVWDGARGYIACLCRDHSRISDAIDVLYIWDVKTGCRERVLHGTASHSMFDHFCKEISATSISGSSLSGNTLVSSLLLPIHEDRTLTHYKLNNSENGATLSKMTGSSTLLANNNKVNSGKGPYVSRTRKQPIKCFCPYPGIATLSFDLAALIDPFQKHKVMAKNGDGRENSYMKEQWSETFSPHHMTSDDGFNTDQS
ncbi:Transducin/WD40 repeat-like superfamily protein isoform 2 [Hibiscus syriacus]|uniref:Transducin/WD40 repeat-like superfamily protein isoform 2 n=1 Tax=Hibiscus syriacus TaxID=106335 RepID=A0A6A3C0P2_HIBSY|nr:Transducin/WD40 repeat-like superfamily protein isoform 2 [Hibiscus syriacus]